MQCYIRQANGEKGGRHMKENTHELVLAAVMTVEVVVAHVAPDWIFFDSFPSSTTVTAPRAVMIIRYLLLLLLLLPCMVGWLSISFFFRTAIAYQGSRLFIFYTT